MLSFASRTDRGIRIGDPHSASMSFTNRSVSSLAAVRNATLRKSGLDRRPQPRARPFGPASEEPYRRRASDWVRLATAVVLLTILAARASNVSATEASIFDLFNSLPRGLEPLFRVLERLGGLWALGLVAAAALLGRRWRLARDLLLSGVLAWAIARVLGSVVVGHIGLRASLKTLTHRATTPAFPLVRLSLVVAVVAAAGPYVGRPVRRLGQALVAVVALSAMYLGAAFPKDVLGGLVLGWAVAAGIHLLFRSPGGRPTSWQLEIALAQVGINATDVRLAPIQSLDGSVFECEDTDGHLRVKAIGRDEVDAQLLAKVWRFLVYKEPAPPLYLTRGQQVEHEACLTLLARSAGVRVPDVVFVGRAGPNAALLVFRPVVGRSLSDLEPGLVSDALLEAIWTEVAKMHAGRIMHGALDAAHVVVDEQGPALVGFARASTTGFEHRRARDVAELLASMAAIVGADRAVSTCATVLGRDILVEAVPVLQPPTLSRQTRSLLGYRDLRKRLDDLRRVAADMAAVEPPALSQLQRLRTSSVLLAASSLVAVAALLNQVGAPEHAWDAARNAAWGWAALALTLSLSTNVPYALALMGTLPLRLPLWPTTELQVAMSYSNLVIPVIGGAGFQIRFLQRQGVDLPAAVAAGGLLSSAGTVLSQVPLLALAIWLSPDSLNVGGVPVSGIVRTSVTTVLALGGVAAIAFGVPRLRRTVLPPVKEAGSTVWTAIRSPRQLTLILGGNLAVSLLYGLCLLCCLRAFGGNLSLWTLLAVSVAVGTFAALVPLPGGSAAVGTVGLAGALTALGVSTQVAVAATLVNQLAVSYLPAAPGWFATQHLLKHDYL
jgi:glycosyltransferase 2 family protein